MHTISTQQQCILSNNCTIFSFHLLVGVIPFISVRQAIWTNIKSRNEGIKAESSIRQKPNHDLLRSCYFSSLYVGVIKKMINTADILPPTMYRVQTTR